MYICRERGNSVQSKNNLTITGKYISKYRNCLTSLKTQTPKMTPCFGNMNTRKYSKKTKIKIRTVFIRHLGANAACIHDVVTPKDSERRCSPRKTQQAKPPMVSSASTQTPQSSRTAFQAAKNSNL